MTAESPKGTTEIQSQDERFTVLAAVAHPDDIEFLFAGTLLLLKKMGCNIHLWNLANGCLGSLTCSPEETANIRFSEAKASAELAAASLHPPLFDDLDIFYNRESLARVASVLRAIQPQIILTHPFFDYMEDHQNAARLITTAAFSRSIPGFKTSPPSLPYSLPVRIYHSAAHGSSGNGLHNQNEFIVDISSVIASKQLMLECHQSQIDWLETTQSMNSLVEQMIQTASSTASNFSDVEFAELWTRHPHLGFCSPDFDPLFATLSDYIRRTPV